MEVDKKNNDDDSSEENSTSNTGHYGNNDDVIINDKAASSCNISNAKINQTMSACSFTTHNDEAGPSGVVPDVHIVHVRHVDDDGVGTSDGIEKYGRTNHGYSYDSIEMLPVLTDLEARCVHRYSVVTDTSDEDQDLGPVQPCSCSCTCHTAGIDDLPSYEKVMMSIQRSDLVLHDDINCTGAFCSSKLPLQKTLCKHRLHVGRDEPKSESSIPCDESTCVTPGGTRKLVSQIDRILNSSGKSSPVSGKEPPNYRSLIFSIIQDEPPKYEEVTGKKLADELVPDSSTTTRVVRARTTSLRRRLMCIGTFVLVITITILLMYLSAAVLDSSIFATRKQNRPDLGKIGKNFGNSTHSNG